MTKRREGTSRVTYSVRLDPYLLKLLKHIAIDENRSVGELLEEGINAVVKKRKSIADYEVEYNRIRMKSDNINVDDERYEIPVFLRERSN